MNQSGLLAWANSIRFTMACDPGRQLFEDQLRTQGFLFLDNYLDSIVAGPVEELIIELVKTPGRKRIKQAKTAITSKLKHVTLSLEDDDGEKENITPVNSFHKALLQVKDKKNDRATYDVDTQPFLARDTVAEQPVITRQENQAPLPTLGTLHVPEIPQGEVVQEVFKPRPVMDPLKEGGEEDLGNVIVEETMSLVPSRSEQNDLSVIAEDDESAERSRVSIHLPRQEPAACMLSDPNEAKSLVSFSAEGVPIPQAPEAESKIQPTLDAEPVHVAPKIAPDVYTMTAWTYTDTNTGNISQAANVLSSTSSFNAPTDFSVPIRNLISPNELKHKVSIPLFPNLPGPLARRSTRAPPDPSTGMLGSATPAPIGGKRSSWLIKAREAKAMEETGKRVSALVMTVAGTKRKSGDMFGNGANEIMDKEEEERKYKVAKVVDGEEGKERRQEDLSTGTRLMRPAPQLPVPTPPQPQYQELMSQAGNPVTPDLAGQEGMLDRLKRTVEGLGARVGKSLGKSLGGAAAASAVAEARAAAQAKVAERERNKEEEDKTAVDRVEVGLTSKSVTVSDESTSTTPPNSPPPTRTASFKWPSGPVFNKPPPVFVPLPVQTGRCQETDEVEKEANLVVPEAFDKDVHREYDEDYLGLDESEIEELEEAGKLTVNLVEPMADRMVYGSQRQLSLSSSSSSHMGLLGQASKLVNSVLGTGKKGKPEVKSLQLAAVAAKKQQEETEKKAARMREMENRRQVALQRKAEEEKSKVMEQERKMKEDGERRKREREEHTDKRLLKGAAKKEEDNTKKRKVFVEIEKKPEAKKPALKNARPSLSTSAPPIAAKSTAKGKGKATPKNADDSLSDKQPSHVVQNQMATRVKAQIQAAKRPESEVASENIELPDINSDFSDSEDEDQPRTFDPPDWAQSPELRQALQMQSTVNPDDIFGAIRPLRMEELFRTRTSRFRARTSSANWHGSDRLTAEEVTEYTRRMGFQQRH